MEEYLCQHCLSLVQEFYFPLNCHLVNAEYTRVPLNINSDLFNSHTDYAGFFLHIQSVSMLIGEQKTMDKYLVYHQNSH